MFRRKGISNGVQTEWNFGRDIFGAKYARETWEPWNRAEVASTRVGGAPPASWAPRLAPGALLPPIYTYVPRNQHTNRENPSSTAATFCSREIPSWGLFWSSPGGGSTTECFYIIIIASPWVVSSLPQTFRSIASIWMASSLSLDLNTKLSSVFEEIYSM